MGNSVKVLKDNLRAEYVAKIFEMFKNEDAGMIASNAFNLPVVDADGNEYELVVKVSLKEEDFVYENRDMYERSLAEKAEKAKAKAEEKARKIEADKARREARAKAKEE